MTTTTTQTPTGAVTMVTLILANGAPVPSVIHLGATAIKPAADGSIVVSSEYCDALFRAGWSYRYPGGASVPVV